MHYFENIQEPLFVTSCFLVVNIINYKIPIFSSIKRHEKKQFGEIFYSLTLIILVLVSYYYNDLQIGLVGVLVMGYADGFAAIIGTKFPYGKYSIYNNTKTLAGSATFFIIAFFVLTIITASQNYIALIAAALILTIIEAISRFGFDNILVPLVASGCYFLIIY